MRERWETMKLHSEDLGSKHFPGNHVSCPPVTRVVQSYFSSQVWGAVPPWTCALSFLEG